jgi:hypothetical protein
MALYSVAAIGGGFFYIFNNAVLPLLIPSSNVLLLNLMSNGDMAMYMHVNRSLR